MKVGFWYNDTKSIKFDKINKINPGVGGTAYLIWLVSYMLNYISYYLTSNDLSTEEMVTIAESLGNTTSVAATK